MHNTALCGSDKGVPKYVTPQEGYKKRNSSTELKKSVKQEYTQEDT